MFGASIGNVTRLKKADGTATFAVASTATIYTPVFELFGGDVFGLALKAAVTSGTPDVLIELEECMNAPTSEAADTTNAVIPDGFPSIINLTDTNLHIKKIEPVPAKYARLKMTGQGTNPASTTVTVDLFRQEWQ